MPASRAEKLLSKVGPLKRLPVLQLLAVAEIAMMAREHMQRLEPYERRRLYALVREGRGRRRNLSPAQQEELATLIAKADPREFAGDAVQRVSPVRLPRRLVYGKRRRDRVTR